LGDPNPKPDDRQGRDRPGKPKTTNEPKGTTKKVSARVAQQVQKAFRDGTFNETFRPSLGYRRQFENSLIAEGLDESGAVKLADRFYCRMDRWIDAACSAPPSIYGSADDFMHRFDTALDLEVEALAR
jgi:hypothetical protein